MTSQPNLKQSEDEYKEKTSQYEGKKKDIISKLVFLCFKIYFRVGLMCSGKKQADQFGRKNCSS